ncbi:MAG: ATP-binding cassette domain-containing protein, partial [Clostridia bacterium]
KVDHLSGGAFSDASFELHKGELLGFFGLVGAGRTEVMRALYGADKRSDGTVTLSGKPLVCRTPTAAVKAGVALISENRKEEGIVPNLNNMDNIALPCLRKFQSGPFINAKAKSTNARSMGAKVGLTPNDPEFMTVSLSGGNAQKVILARWMSTDAEIMIFDEPTKGIDIGAKAEIYKLMEDILESGKSIIMVSSELTEIMGMSDRILVMREGKIVADLDRAQFAEDTILNYAVEGE